MPASLAVPEPPVAEGVGLPWDVSVDDAVAAIAAARARYGDTFAVRSGDDHYLFTFSPTGVEAFYGLPEEKASKGVADYLMLRRKLPDEIFDGRRVLPTSLFRRDDVAYVSRQPRPCLGAYRSRAGNRRDRRSLRPDPPSGAPHGLGVLGGTRLRRGDPFERLVLAFETLDGSDAFVHPDAMAAVAASDKRAERAALDDVVAVIETAARASDSNDVAEDDLFGRIVECLVIGTR